jgi:hypothetical protein
VCHAHLVWWSIRPVGFVEAFPIQLHCSVRTSTVDTRKHGWMCKNVGGWDWNSSCTRRRVVMRVTAQTWRKSSIVCVVQVHSQHADLQEESLSALCVLYIYHGSVCRQTHFLPIHTYKNHSGMSTHLHWVLACLKNNRRCSSKSSFLLWVHSHVSECKANRKWDMGAWWWFRIFIFSLVRWFVGLLVCRFVGSLVRSLVRSFVRSLHLSFFLCFFASFFDSLFLRFFVS